MAKQSKQGAASRRSTPEITISVEEAGRRYFDVSKNTAYKLVEDGTIPAIRIGRLLRVPIRGMEARIDAACKQSA